MKKYFIVLFCMMLLLPFSVKAYYCDYTALTRLKKIADNVMVSYDYVEENGKVRFTVTLSNLHPEVYVVEVAANSKNNKTYYFAGNELVLSYEGSKIVQYNIYAVDQHGCDEVVLATKYATLPDYNAFYTDPVCQGAESYGLCQKWQKVSMSYENFLKQVNAYKEGLKNDGGDEEKPNDKGNDVIGVVLAFIGKYYYIVLIVIILGGSVVLIRHYKKNSFKL